MNPWVIATQIGLSIGLEWLNRQLNDPLPDKRPRSMSNLPSTAEGDVIPLVFGKVRVRRPATVWYGGFKEYSAFAISGTLVPPGVTHYYGMNLLFAMLPHADIPTAFTNARLTGVYFDERKLELNLGHLDSVQLTGDSTDGGLSAALNAGPGLIQFFAGSGAQAVTNYNPDINTETNEIAYWMRHPDGAAVDYTLIPGYRNQMLVALSGDRDRQLNEDQIEAGEKLGAFVFGPTTALPEISLEILTQWDRYTALHPEDADPAAALVQVLTKSWGGFGIDPANIDDVSFGAAAVTLAAEGNGYSREIDSKRNGKQIVQEIADQTAGVVYQDPVTGKVHYKLLRDDYDPATIPSFETKHVVKVERYIPQGWPELINRVEVAFENRALHYTEDIAIAFNQAASVLQAPQALGGATRVVQVEYPGCKSKALANQLATRDLSLLAQPLAQLRVIFNRLADVHGTSNAAMLRPGDVFKLHVPNHKINNVIFRATRVEPGQLGDNKVAVDAVTDAFSIARPALPDDDPDLFTPVPVPIRERVLTEAPRWIQLLLTNQGLLPGVDVQRVLASARAADAALHYRVPTRKLDGPLLQPYLSDVLQETIPLTARVTVAYAREKDPYDTSTGIVIEDCKPNTFAALAALVWDENSIRAGGFTLIMINGELLAFDSATDLGGGQFRLDGVWRALLDTAPRDHAVGDLVHFLGFGTLHRRVGKRGWSDATLLAGTWIPTLGTVTGSGDEPSDVLELRQRHLLPARVADFCLAGENMEGNLGEPATAGRFKRVTLLEEGLDVFATRRNRLASTVVRGDDADETQTEDDIDYLVRARKGDAAAVEIAQLDNLGAIDGDHGLLIGGVGHGEIDVSITTRRIIFDPHSVPLDVLESWDSPAIRVTAPVWRNLLANSRFDYGALAPGWGVTNGVPVVDSQAAVAISRDTTTSYVRANSAAQATVSQLIDVAGYSPRALAARLVYYQRALNSDTNDTCTATLRAHDAASGNLGAPAAQTIATVATHWSRTSLVIASLPANTAKLSATFALNEVTTLGTTTPEVAITEAELIVGNHLYDVLANPSFETGSTASWTNAINSFVVATTIRSPSGNYAQGGAFASSSIRQEYTVPAGWEVGSSIVLRCWRAQTIASDTGSVRIELRDSLNNPVGTDWFAQTGAEDLATLNQWVRRRLTLTIPDNAANGLKVVVILTAVRTGGAGNSGACFDELVLSVHKELDAQHETELVFDTPSTHPTPATWQAWTLALPDLYDAGVKIPVVLAGRAPSVNRGLYRPLLMQWSDGVTRPPAKLRGLFALGVTEIEAYPFARQSGAGALDFQAVQEPASKRFLAPRSADQFTVIVEFMIDEDGFATACGLIGRRDASSGWELAIDATGHVSAVLHGTGGTKTATRPSTTVHDGALHLAAIVYDPIAETLTVYDERGGTSVSTAAGLGEIATAAACKLRLGRGRDTIDTLPGLIGRVFCFPGVALSSAQVLAHWNYALDPTGQLTTYTRTAAAVVPIEPGGEGEQACVMSADQVAIAHRTTLELDGGTGYGLAVGRAATNLIPSLDFAGASWVPDGATVLTHAISDITGRARGVRVAGDATNGLKVIGLAAGAVPASLSLSFWARTVSGSASLDVDLLTSADADDDSETVVLTGQWQRYDLTWTWSGATATCRFRWRSDAGAAVFELAGVMYAGEVLTSAIHPAVIPMPAATHGDYNAVATVAMPRQFNREGELVAQGSMLFNGWTIASDATILLVKNGANDKNRRELQQRVGGGNNDARLVHFDGAGSPASVTSDLDYTHWHDRVWTLRGRWCSIGLNDVTAGRFAHVAIGDHVAPSPVEGAAGRTAIWTHDTTLSTAIEIGTGSASPEDLVLRRVVARAREEKLS